MFEPGDNKCYVVTFPDLPGCITEGDNMEEALHMAKEALELFLFSMEEDGEMIPEPTLPDKIKIKEGWFIKLLTDIASRPLRLFRHIEPLTFVNTFVIIECGYERYWSFCMDT